MSGAEPSAPRPPGTASAGLLGALYRALWYPALPFALLAAGGFNAADRRERLGYAPIATPPAARRVWIHAASVGEIEAVRPIARGLLQRLPDAALIVTTMTAAGRDAARRRIPDAAAWRLAPLDCPASMRAFLARVRPALALIAETELWPNLLCAAARAGARVAIVNGRLSERSLRRYRLIQPLIAGALGRLDLALVQTGDDARRFIALGAPAPIVIVTGNTKFERGEPPPLRPELRDFAAGRPLLVAGSTAPGEERMALNAYRNLRERFPELALALAPRHLDRAAAVGTEIQAAGLAYARASAPPSAAIGAAAPAGPRATPVLLLDTMGELRALYAHAAIAFVGGSIAPPRGGQNLAEPAAAAVPVIFGPHYENQRQMGDALLDAGGARVVRDAAELESVCAEWLADADARRAAGARARGAFERLAGGSAATLDHLERLFRSV